MVNMNFPVNKIQPVVNPDTSIVFFGELWDIGVRVVKWYERGGYDGYATNRVIVKREDRRTGKVKTKVIKGKRYGRRFPPTKRKISDITQFVVHHTGGFLPGVCFNTLHNERKLSVQFIIDDFGVIYQTMDCMEIAWHGGPQNPISLGAELCLYPLADINPEAYRKSKRDRFGLAPHDIGQCYIQGKKRTVFLMPNDQVESVSFLIAGVWAARDSNIDGLKLPPVFPERSSGEGPDLNFSEEHKQHEGIVLHANVSEIKWDAAGIDPVEVEDRVSVIYYSHKKGIENVTG